MIENRNLHTEVNWRIVVGYKNSNVTTDRGGGLFEAASDPPRRIKVIGGRPASQV